MAAERAAWKAFQPEIDIQRLVFIDETGASTKMARLYGRSPYGQRCVAALPHGHWKTTTFVGALRATGMTAPMVLDGPMDGLAFEAYVTQVLVPTLKPGDIVVMDNLAVQHKRAEVAVGQNFSWSGVICKAALMMPTRASVKALRSSALRCRIPAVEDVSAAKARGDAVMRTAVATTAIFLIIIANSKVSCRSPPRRNGKRPRSRLI